MPEYVDLNDIFEDKPKRKTGGRKERAESQTELLAKSFVVEYLGEAFDYRRHKVQLAQAKNLVNPKGEARAYTAQQVLGCLKCLSRGMFDFGGDKVYSLGIVTSGEPKPFIEQYLDYVNSPPPTWNMAEVSRWQELTGNTYASHIANDERRATINLVIPRVEKKKDGVEL